MKFEVVKKGYAVDIDSSDFAALISYENENVLELSLLEKLGEKGCYQIEYDHMFGNSVFFTLNDGDDTPGLRDELGKIIDDHISMCKTYFVEANGISP